MNINENEKKALDLLKRKRDALQEVLLYTNGVKLTGDDSDAIKYVSLMQKRNEIFDRMRLIDVEMEHPDIKAILGDGCIKELSELKEECKETAGRIMKLDEELNKAAAAVMVEIKRQMKEMKAGKNVSALYRNETMLGQYAHFDQKK